MEALLTSMSSNTTELTTTAALLYLAVAAVLGLVVSYTYIKTCL